MEPLKIIGLLIFSAIGYGIVHDQITARVCLEYFTVFHPDLFHTTSPTLLALGWGVVATWWAGLMIGVPLAAAARAGSWPKVRAIALIRPVITMLIAMGLFATLTGVAGYFLARNGTIKLAPDWAAQLPPAHRAGFVADWFAHITSYFVGFLCGSVLCISTIYSRHKAATRLKPAA